jgi:hypothetical protein
VLHQNLTGLREPARQISMDRGVGIALAARRRITESFTGTGHFFVFQK